MSRKSVKFLLTPADKRILNRLQQGISLAERPWKAMAGELAIKEEFLLKRIACLKEIGVIRRISAGFSPRRAGFVSTLMAAKAAPGNIKEAVEKINSYPEVTHNYKRYSEYNIWFALVARDNKRISRIKNELMKCEKIEKLLDLPAVKLFKIDVKFHV